MSSILERFAELVARGTPHTPPPGETNGNGDSDAVNRPSDDVNTHIHAIMADEDMRAAIIGLIDRMSAESTDIMGRSRKDHADMLFHHGGYARLQEFKVELTRLAGLTND